jgi:glucose/arabinose dehydrogenase
MATSLKKPRQTLVLSNGDILVVEGKGGDRLTLLRDANNDGVYESRTVFATKSNAPFGLALTIARIYVAGQDSLVRFDYRIGQTHASPTPVIITRLPSGMNPNSAVARQRNNRRLAND